MRNVDVTISGEGIRLGQFLGRAGLAVGALHAKVMIVEGWVTVNGRVETQPGRQLRPGDLVATTGRSARVVTAAPGPARPNEYG